MRDYQPEDLVEHTDVANPQADTIQFVTVSGKEEIFLYEWDSETETAVHSVVGFDYEGIEKLQEWITNAKLEAEEDTRNEFGEN